MKSCPQLALHIVINQKHVGLRRVIFWNHKRGISEKSSFWMSQKLIFSESHLCECHRNWYLFWESSLWMSEKLTCCGESSLWMSQKLIWSQSHFSHGDWFVLRVIFVNVTETDLFWESSSLMSRNDWHVLESHLCECHKNWYDRKVIFFTEADIFRESSLLMSRIHWVILIFRSQKLGTRTPCRVIVSSSEHWLSHFGGRNSSERRSWI